MEYESDQITHHSVMITLNILNKPIDQTWSVERIASEAPPITWEDVFRDANPELHDVSIILREEEEKFGTYYPLRKDTFASFNYTPLNNVKVVILGQDPYHQTISVNGASVPRAVGLSFSVRQEDSIPSSLQNIYTELSNTVRGFSKPDHGDLREWARQGVLLLNTCLTVKPNQAGSHGDIWLGFMNKVFKAIATVNPYCIYLLWGREAQKVKPMLGERSITFEAAHPSGLSARRGFFGCNHFNLVNETLIRHGKVGINWRISSLAEIRNPISLGISSPPPTQPIQIHKPILVPVNVDNLTHIMPHITVGMPTILGPPTDTIAIRGLLPIIPNTKKTYLFPMVGFRNITKAPEAETTDKPLFQTRKSPKTYAPEIPTIPTIVFGNDLKANPVIHVEIPQILNTVDIRPITKAPTIIELPIILPLTH